MGQNGSASRYFYPAPRIEANQLIKLNILNSGFLYIQEIQSYSKVQSFNPIPLVSLHSMNTFNI